MFSGGAGHNPQATPKKHCNILFLNVFLLSSENGPSAAQPAAIERERACLLRYARLQLRDSALAEDAVQETLIAALEGAARFAGKSSLRTWLTGILKHKIIDHLPLCRGCRNFSRQPVFI